MPPKFPSPSAPDTAPAAPPETSGLAIASLIFGILGLVWGLTSLPAIICGHLSRARIKRSPGHLSGGGMAQAGLVMGYFTLLLYIGIGVMAALAFNTVREKSKETSDLSNAKQIATAIKLYALDHHNRTPPNLAALVPDYLPHDEILKSAIAHNGEPNACEYLLPDTDIEAIPDPENTVILRGHYVSTLHGRVVVYVDTHAEIKREGQNAAPSQ